MNSEDIHYLRSLITVGELCNPNLIIYINPLLKGSGPPEHEEACNKEDGKKMVGGIE